MEIYINGASCISPQNSFNSGNFFEEIIPLHAPMLTACEPDYKTIIPAASLRRMSHILKMGVSTALDSMKEAAIEKPDAIITGTAMGCFEDTDKFLRNMGDNAEQLLNPTAFIQSTHNTVAAQIALATKCHGYNFTYTQQAHSFENALSDGILHLNENPDDKVLVGAMDEANLPLLEMYRRAGYLIDENSLPQNIWESTHDAFSLGEGSAFFVLSKQKTKTSKARLLGVKDIHSVNNSANLENRISEFLSAHDLTTGNIDLVLSGNSGNAGHDKIINEINDKLFPHSSISYFKALSGEYFTASSFGMWLGVKMLSEKKVPFTASKIKKNSFKNTLLINHYCNRDYSLILLSAC